MKSMPKWFTKQLQKAYYDKNIYAIKLLNQSWFFKVNNMSKERVEDGSEKRNGESRSLY